MGLGEALCESRCDFVYVSRERELGTVAAGGSLVLFLERYFIKLDIRDAIVLCTDWTAEEVSLLLKRVF